MVTGPKPGILCMLRTWPALYFAGLREPFYGALNIGTAIETDINTPFIF
jgi:hypothetical protein